MATKPVRIGYGEVTAAAGILLCEGDARAFYNAHGVRLGSPGWAEDSHSIAVTFRSGPRHLPFSLHVMFNAYWEALDFDLPPAPAAAIGGWRRWIDTSLEPPDDIVEAAAAPPLPGTQYRVAPRSVVALFSQTSPRAGVHLSQEYKDYEDSDEYRRAASL